MAVDGNDSVYDDFSVEKKENHILSHGLLCQYNQRKKHKIDINGFMPAKPKGKMLKSCSFA